MNYIKKFHLDSGLMQLPNPYPGKHKKSQQFITHSQKKKTTVLTLYGTVVRA